MRSLWAQTVLRRFLGCSYICRDNRTDGRAALGSSQLSAHSHDGLSPNRCTKTTISYHHSLIYGTSVRYHLCSEIVEWLLLGTAWLPEFRWILSSK